MQTLIVHDSSDGIVGSNLAMARWLLKNIYFIDKHSIDLSNFQGVQEQEISQ